MNFNTAFIEITNICEKKCKHCFNLAFNNIKSAEITVNDFRRLILSMKKEGIDQIKIVGGEPTLHSRFQEIIETLDDCDISYVIFTDHKNIIYYIETFKKCRNLRHIRISIDGNKKVHDYIRNVGSYDELVEAMEILKSHNVPIKINYTINRLNYKCIKEVYEMAQVLGVSISFSAMKICRSGFCEELMLNKNEMDSFIHGLIWGKILRYEIVLNILKDISDDRCFINTQKKSMDSRHIGCLAGQKNCVVDVYGNVWPCSLLKGESQFNYGNVFKQSLKEILETMSLDWSNLSREYDECDKCKYTMYCTGGCRSNAYYSGGIAGKDPYCLLYSNLYYGLDNIRKSTMSVKE